jgi:hypothetical protein
MIAALMWMLAGALSQQKRSEQKLSARGSGWNIFENLINIKFVARAGKLSYRAHTPCGSLPISLAGVYTHANFINSQHKQGVRNNNRSPLDKRTKARKLVGSAF